VTIAKRPCVWAGMAADREVICAKWEQKYFYGGDWTGDSVICPTGKVSERDGALYSFYLRHSGASRSDEPGIHNHDREYGFQACAKWRIPE